MKKGRLLTEYEMELITRDILKKYCSNCAEEIKYPKPGWCGTIWKEIEISVHKTEPDFVTTGEFYLCEDCIEVKEKRYTHKKSPKDDRLRKYCKNCKERVNYPEPGEYKSIWCLSELIGDIKGLGFIKGGEFYYCDKCIRLKEERHKDSPMDNLVYDADEDWEKIVNEDRWNQRDETV